MLQSLVVLLAAQAAAAAKLNKRSASAYVSSADGVYNLSGWTAPVSGTGNANGESTWSLTIDDTSSGYKQKISGFGAAVTDATVAVFNDLSSSSRAALFKSLFTSAGANFSLLRHTIGASDLSADPAYTYDDNGGKVDTSLSGFNLGDRGNAMAEMLAEMKAVNSGIQILGSSWSAPGWMKLNGVIDGTTTNNNINHAYYTELAQYFVKYVQAYQAKGATINAITIQNEPLYSASGYPTMYLFATEEVDIAQNYVGPAFANAGLGTKIWAYDHNTDHPEYPGTVISGVSSSYCPAVAWHCYANPLDWTVLTTFHNEYPNIDQYMTECWTSPDTNNWHQASSFTIGPLQNWARGAMAWTLGTSTSFGPHLSTGGCGDCRGLVTVDTSADTYAFQIDYFMMAQYSKFMPVGATVLSGTGSYTYSSSNQGIQSVATFNPDGTRTVVIENTFGNNVYVTLTTKSGETWSGDVYKDSVVTWVLPKAA